MKNQSIVLLICSIFVASCGTKKNQMNQNIKEPVAKIIPKELEKHGDIRIDNYYWMNERENQEVIDYLNEGDLLVLNDTRVLPARIYGTRVDTGAVVEFVLLKQLENKKGHLKHQSLKLSNNLLCDCSCFAIKL